MPSRTVRRRVSFVVIVAAAGAACLGGCAGPSSGGPSPTQQPVTASSTPAGPRLTTPPDTYAVEEGTLHFPCSGPPASGSGADAVGPATSVVLIGGYDETADAWSGLQQRLGQSRRSCVLDLPEPLTDTGANRSAQQIAGILQTVVPRGRMTTRFVLVGHSFGGMTAIAFAAAHPGEVSRVVLLDPTPPSFISANPTMFVGAVGWDLTASVSQLRQDSQEWPGVPLVLLSSDPVVHEREGMTVPEEQQWLAGQHALAAAVHGTQQVVRGSGHDVALAAPDLVTAAITGP